MAHTRDIENQEVLIETLKNSADAFVETYPTDWAKQRGYIATFEFANIVGGHESEGVDYVVLTDSEIAYRTSGDNREDGEWIIDSPETFWSFVIEDAQDVLEELKKPSTV